MSIVPISFKYKIAVIGLGYVGLPLAVAFAKKFQVVGFDIDDHRVQELGSGNDWTGEISKEELTGLQFLQITSHKQLLENCNIFIVTVPTPLDSEKKPDIHFLLDASEAIGTFLKKGDIVIYESTVYPGCTEEDCVPVLERVSGLKYNHDFFCGYSPERINPGDKVHTLTNIVKVTSGSTPATAEVVDALYNTIIAAGTFRAPSIKIAEAAKAVENAQRDINISFMNELALIFDKMGLDTMDVLDAASTKWNFLPFRPGLVGGHCIGVDPHYLAFKSFTMGYQPEVILSGRKVNDQMGFFVAEKTMKLLASKFDNNVKGKKVLILGFAFKENCADTRNTKVVDTFRTLTESGFHVSLYDPLVNPQGVFEEYGIQMSGSIPENNDAVIIAVAHDAFRQIDFTILKNKGAIIFDAKGFLPRELTDARL